MEIGHLASEFGKRFQLEVCQSAAGFYLGTRDEDGCPYSRESVEYWGSRESAEAALEGRAPLTQREHV